MQRFREFVADQDYDAVKHMVFNVLDPQDNTIDPDSNSIFSRPLSDFKRRHNLLTTPGLADIINRRKNRGAIEAAIENSSTTIGNLLALLTQEDEPKYLG